MKIYQVSWSEWFSGALVIDSSKSRWFECSSTTIFKVNTNPYKENMRVHKWKLKKKN